jgi:hypothetical protein
MDRYHNNRQGADRAFWLRAYDGGSFSKDRVTTGHYRIDILSLSILGGVQPERLRELLAAKVLSDGLLARFVPVLMRHAGYGCDEPRDIDATEGYAQLIRDLYNLMPITVHVSLDISNTIRQQLSERLQDFARAGYPSAWFAAFAGKLEGVWAALALVLHCIEKRYAWPAPELSEDVAERARHIVEDFMIPSGVAFAHLLQEGTIAIYNRSPPPSSVIQTMNFHYAISLAPAAHCASRARTPIRSSSPWLPVDGWNLCTLVQPTRATVGPTGCLSTLASSTTGTWRQSLRYSAGSAASMTTIPILILIRPRPRGW